MPRSAAGHASAKPGNNLKRRRLRAFAARGHLMFLGRTAGNGLSPKGPASGMPRVPARTRRSDSWARIRSRRNISTTAQGTEAAAAAAVGSSLPPGRRRRSPPTRPMIGAGRGLAAAIHWLILMARAARRSIAAKRLGATVQRSAWPSRESHDRPCFPVHARRPRPVPATDAVPPALHQAMRLRRLPTQHASLARP